MIRNAELKAYSLTVTLFAILLAFETLSLHAAATIAVMQSGDPAPDGNGTFFSFREPANNNARHAVAQANLIRTAGGNNDNSGIFRGEPRNMTVQIAREGQSAPDGNGRFATFFTPLLNDLGQAAFHATLSDSSGGTDDELGLFLGDGTGDPIQVVRKGDAAPDGNGQFRLLHFRNHELNNSGQIAFIDSLTDTIRGGADNDGMFRADGVNPIVQIARQGQRTPDGNDFFQGFSNFDLNDLGQVAFDANIGAAGGGPFGGRAIYRTNGMSELVRISRSGDVAPDGVGVMQSGSLGNVSNSGEVAFWGTFEESAGSSSILQGIFRGDGAGSLVEIARTGQEAAGIGTFSRLLFPYVDDSGQVTFNAELRPASGGRSDEEGFYRGTGSGLTQIVRTGQLAPDGVSTFLGFGAPRFNDAGQFAFSASLDNTPGGTADNFGVYFYNNAGGISRVVREGQEFLGSAIASFSFRSGPNAQGHVTFNYRLADSRRGVAIWGIPEPASLVHFAVATAMVMSRRTLDSLQMGRQTLRGRMRF